MQRVVYTDDTGSEVVLAVQGFAPDSVPNSTNALTSMDHSTEIFQLNKFNKYKVWTNSSLYGDMPLAASDFNTAEPEIFVQEYDGSSWVNKFRGFLESEGAAKGDGSFEFTLHDHSKWVGTQQASISGVTGGIDDILQAILPSGYVVESPTDVTIPTLQDYSLNDEIQVGFRDVTEKFNWTLRFTGRTDSNGNYIVRHEPYGYGGTVDTLTGQSSGGLTKFKEWEKGKTSGIINKVTVVGNDANGNKVRGTVQDSTSISDYGESFKRVPVDFNIPDTSTAETIAASYINAEPTEGGRVKKQAGYSEPVINDSFELHDNDRNLTGEVFTAVKQKNYYPEGSTELDFEFEKESERQARESDNLRGERSEVKENNDKDVGNQGTTGIETGEAPSDTAPAGSLDTAGGSSKVEETNQGGISTSVSDTQTKTISSISFGSTNTSGAYISINFKIEPSNDPSSTQDTKGFWDFNVWVENQSTGEIYPIGNTFYGTGFHFSEQWYATDTSTGASWIPYRRTVSVVIPEDTSNTTFNIIGEADGGSIDVSGRVIGYSMGEHDHGIGNLLTEDFNHGGLPVDPIEAVDTTNSIFTVGGDETAKYDSTNSNKDDIRVEGSSGNDGAYTVANVSYDSNNDQTDITVNESISDSTANGVVVPEGQHNVNGSTDSKNVEVENTVKEDRTP